MTKSILDDLNLGDDTSSGDPVGAIRQVAAERGINPDHLIGLAKLETRLGDASIKGGGNDTRNLFNIKDISGAGTGIRARDKAEGSNDRYRQYASYKESVEDLVGLLDRRYPGALDAETGQKFAESLKRGGYATDPNYVSKLTGVIGGARTSGLPEKPAVAPTSEQWLASLTDDDFRGAGGLDQSRVMDRVNAPAAKETSMLESIGDSGVALGAGLLGGAKSLTDVFGADNRVSGFLDSATKSLDGLTSPGRKIERRNRQAQIKDAEENGTALDEILANIGAFADAPIDVTLGAIGSSAPTLLSLLIPGANVATAGRLIASGAMGMTQGVGAAKGSIFEAVEQKLIENKVDKDTARKVAAGAQAYDGENAGMIAANGGLGILAAITGADKSIAQFLSKKAGKEIAEKSADGLVKSMAKGVAKEAPLESSQGGFERVTSNVALQNAGFDTPTFQGAAGQATLEGLASSPLGAAGGLMDRSKTSAAAPPPVNPLTQQLTQSGGVLSNAALAGNPGLKPADPFTQRANEVKAAMQNGGLQTLRDIGPQHVQDFLSAIQVAGDTRMPATARQEAIDTLNIGMQWMADGKTSDQPATGSPYSTELTVPPGVANFDIPTQDALAQDLRTVDGQTTEINENQIGGPRALPGPPGTTTQEQPASAGFFTPEDSTSAAPSNPDMGNPISAETPESIVAQAAQSTNPNERIADVEKAPVAQQAAPQGPKAPAAPAAGVTPVARKQVTAPNVAALPESAGNLGTAQMRKRKAQLTTMAAAGFQDVERRPDGFFLVNPAKQEELRLDSPGDAQMARAVIAKTPATLNPITGASNGQNAGAAGAGVDPGGIRESRAGAQNGASADSRIGGRDPLLREPGRGSGATGGAAQIQSAGNPDPEGVERVTASNAPALIESAAAIRGYRNRLNTRLAGETNPAKIADLKEEIRKIPQIGRPPADATQTFAIMANAWQKTFGGVAPIAYWDESRSAVDGFEQGGRTHVNLANPDMALQWTIGHEADHAQEKSADATEEALRDELWSNVSENGRRIFFEGFKFKGKRYAQATPEQLATLRSEMLAEFQGGRWTDAEWLGELGRKKPFLFGQFLAEWIPTLSRTIDALKSRYGIGEDSPKNVDKFMKNLVRAKEIAMEMAIIWAEKNQSLAQKTGLGDAIQKSQVSDAQYSARTDAEQEYRDVVAELKDGKTWLRAPNGEPTKLTERQWVQARTPSFLKWFGDWRSGNIWGRDDVSKAVGDDGEPVVVYHGTDKGGFMSFKQPGGSRRGDLGIFTTDNQSMARSYVRRGQPQELNPKSDADKLNEIGILIEDFEGRLSSRETQDRTLYQYTDPNGQEAGPFATEQEAIKDAISDFWDGEEEVAPAVYAAFVNLRNPNEEDFEGALWSGSREHQWTVQVGGETQYKDGKQYFEEQEARAFAKEFADPDDEYEGADFMVAAEEHWQTTDDVVSEGLEYKNDGAIIRQVVDDGGGNGYDMTPSDVFVAFKPNQLKSADFNTGEFGQSDDIRYSAPDRPRDPVNAGYSEQADALRSELEELGAEVKDVVQIDQLIGSKDIPVLTLQDLVGLNIFPTIADRTGAAAVYKGIDSSTLNVAIPLLGGPLFPLRLSNWLAGIVWANRGKGVTSQKAAKLKEGASYMMVVLGDADMHQSNSTVAAAVMGTLEAWQRDGRISAENIENLGNMVRGASGSTAVIKEYLENFPGFDDASIMYGYMDGMSFDARKRVIELLASKQALALGAPPVNLILDATREPSMAGHRWGDGVLLLEVDQENLQVDLGTEGTTAHPDFPVGIRGRVVGRMNAPINWEMLWQDWAKQWRADKLQVFDAMASKKMQSLKSWDERISAVKRMADKGDLTEGAADMALVDLVELRKNKRKTKEVDAASKDRVSYEKGLSERRAFELSRPIARVTQDLVNRIGPINLKSIDGARQARLASDFAAGNWRETGVAVKDGGASPQEFIDAILTSAARPVMSEYTLKQVKQGAKNGTFKAFQLGANGQIFFGLKYGDPGYTEDYGIDIPQIGKNEVALVSVINNEQGARGIAAPAVVLKALQEKATVLDCFAVKSENFPDGFLPELYAAFGFEKVAEVAFSKEYFQDGNEQKLADAVKFWQDTSPGYSPETNGYPPLVIMKWKGLDADRTDIINRYLRAGITGVLNGRASPIPKKYADRVLSSAGAEGDQAGSDTDAQRDPGDQGDRAGARIASRAQRTVQGIANLNDGELRNLGLTTADRSAVRKALGQDESQPSDGPQFSERKVKSAVVRLSVDELVAAAESMGSWRDWYDRHEAIITDMFGQDARLFQQILSATSQAASVKANVGLALKAYRQYLSGEEFVGYLPAVIKNLNRIKDNTALSGAKISQYDDANNGDDGAIAVDRHIAMLFFDTKTPSRLQIISAKESIRSTATRLGWKPKEVQAALWAYNQVRLGTDPTKVISYDTILNAKTEQINQLRAQLGRGEAEGVRTDGAADWRDAVTQDFPGGSGAGDDQRSGRASGDGSRRSEGGSTEDRQVPAPGEAAGRAEIQNSKRLEPLPGAPSIKGFSGPDPRLVAIAEQYAQANGIDLKRQSEYVQIDPQRATRIADAYEAMPHAPNDPRIKEAFSNLIRQTTAQYQALVGAGYKFWFVDFGVPGNEDYVSTPWNALRDIRANQEMGIYPTESGFGDTAIGKDLSGNPLEDTDTGLMWPSGGLNGPLKRVLANDLFRAVHDAFGHGLEGAGFRAQGEENAWQAHSRLFTGSALGAITTETRGQNSWVNFGPNGEKNRTAAVGDTVFADQKTGLMPEWTWTEGRAGDVKLSQRNDTNGPAGRPTQPDSTGGRVGAAEPDRQRGAALPVARGADQPGRGRAPDSAVRVQGAIHYGKRPGLSILSGSSSGTGIRGAEQDRLKTAADKRIRQRVYFYLPVDGGIPQPEIGLGGSVYRADLGGLYDTTSGVVRGSGNDFESAVLDAGYRGYINLEQGTAVILGEDVPVDYVGSISDQTVVQRRVERITPKNVTRTEGAELVRKPDAAEMIQLVNPAKRAKIQAAAPSFKMQYGFLRVLQSEAALADQAMSEFSPTFRFGKPQFSERNDTERFTNSVELRPSPGETVANIDRRKSSLKRLLRCVS